LNDRVHSINKDQREESHLNYNKIQGFAIVTGGARGLGKAMVLQLASEGYDVVINYVSSSSNPLAEEVAKRCKEEFGVGAICVQADVSEYENCRLIVQAGIAAFGDRIAVLINNAGYQNGRLFHDLAHEKYEKLIGVELLGSMHLTHLVLPYMRKVKNGCIICISSIGAKNGQAMQCDYDAAKAGMYGFIRGIASENAMMNIRANTISPGNVMTELWEAFPKEAVDAVAQTIPMKRMGMPEDIAQCMSYIVNATWLTGQDISPNGGSIY
jgi:3-oxoacyl-[acyl-carrier protein] reductase